MRREEGAQTLRRKPQSQEPGGGLLVQHDGKRHAAPWSSHPTKSLQERIEEPAESLLVGQGPPRTRRNVIDFWGMESRCDGLVGSTRGHG